jgi:hypothetical protein|tara:strand:+ start:293 stop:1147 length:855 start_codon:yes stop_codon:yes gene_type:complete
MRIKHSKYKNTGLIFELLVKQIASDTLNKKDSKAVEILKQYFTGRSALVREFKLYEFVLKNKTVSQSKAESIVSTIIEVSRSIDKVNLKKQKYSLIKEIKDNYDIKEFFSINVKDYKPLAALYCLMEAHKITDVIDPNFLVDNKTTILEHLTRERQDKKQVRDTLIEEYGKYDKDLKLLTFKILLEKFNSKYGSLLPEQKNILREFITSVDSSTKLRKVVNEELKKLKNIIIELKNSVEDEIVAIKLQEVAKTIQPVAKTKRVTDDHLINIMQYYELVQELKGL